MKTKSYVQILILAASLLTVSCLKEDNVSAPVVNGVRMFVTDVNSKDSLVTVLSRGQRVKFVVDTRADMVSVWPGGIRKVMKKKNSDVDSIDIFKNPVLEVSDSYTDYGLVKARGLNTTVGDDGWYVFYTYPDAGEFDLTVVATNHGYDGPDLRRAVYSAGKVTVK